MREEEGSACSAGWVSKAALVADLCQCPRQPHSPLYVAPAELCLFLSPSSSPSEVIDLFVHLSHDLCHAADEYHGAFVALVAMRDPAVLRVPNSTSTSASSGIGFVRSSPVAQSRCLDLPNCHHNVGSCWPRLWLSSGTSHTSTGYLTLRLQ